MLVIGCIEAKFCKKICVGKLSPRSTQCTPLHRFGIHWRKMGKKGLAKTTPKRKKPRKREANKQRAASHLVLRWKGAAKKIAKVTNEYAEVVWVSFLYFLFHYVFNVHLNCGGSEYAPVRSIDSRTTYDTRCQCPWYCDSIAMVRCKVPSKGGVPPDRRGPNQPRGLGNGERAT